MFSFQAKTREVITIKVLKLFIDNDSTANSIFQTSCIIASSPCQTFDTNSESKFTVRNTTLSILIDVATQFNVRTSEF
jgi:hypothetical protein